MGRVSMLEGEEKCQRDPCSAIQRHFRGSMQLVTTAQEAKIAITTGQISLIMVARQGCPLLTTVLTIIAIMYQSRLVIIKGTVVEQQSNELISLLVEYLPIPYQRLLETQVSETSLWTVEVKSVLQFHWSCQLPSRRSAKEALPPHHTSPTCRQRHICIICPVLTRSDICLCISEF